MPIEKAQMDAAFNDFERRMESRIDSKIDNLREEINTQIHRKADQEEVKRERIEEEAYDGTNQKLDELRNDFHRAQEEIEGLEARIAKLEEMISSQEKDDDFFDNDISSEF